MLCWQSESAGTEARETRDSIARYHIGLGPGAAANETIKPSQSFLPSRPPCSTLRPPCACRLLLAACNFLETLIGGVPADPPSTAPPVFLAFILSSLALFAAVYMVLLRIPVAHGLVPQAPRRTTAVPFEEVPHVPRVFVLPQRGSCSWRGLIAKLITTHHVSPRVAGPG